MPKQITLYRVFIASPGGLQPERKIFREVVELFNEKAALLRDCSFQPVGWEDTLGGAGRPQSIINDELRTCDYFLMLLWDRWGSNPGKTETEKFTSGTEEEFAVAKELATRGKMKLAILFKAIDAQRLSDPGRELQRVLKFRSELESSKEYLYNTFDAADAFRHLLERFLNRWLFDNEQKHPERSHLPDLTNISKVILEPVDSKPEPSIRVEDSLLSQPTLTLIARAREALLEERLTEAESLFAKAVESGDSPEALQAYGDFLIRIGRNSQAVETYKRLLDLSQTAGRRWAMVANAGLGDAHLRRDQSEAAEGFYREAFAIAEELQSPLLKADQLCNIARVFLLRKQVLEAAEFARAALGMYDQIMNRRGIAAAQNVLGQVHIEAGALDDAEKDLQESLAIYRALNYPDMVASVLNNLGLVFFRRKEFGRAKELFTEALAINTKRARKLPQAINRQNLGSIAEKEGDYQSARRGYRSALEIFRSIDEDKRASAMETALSILAAQMGKTEKI